MLHEGYIKMDLPVKLPPLVVLRAARNVLQDLKDELSDDPIRDEQSINDLDNSILELYRYGDRIRNRVPVGGPSLARVS